MGVKVSYEELGRLHRQLTWIINEFEGASDRTDDLQESIGAPYEQGRLRRVAGEFESRWDGKRADLLEDVHELRRNVRKVVNGFEDWDRGAEVVEVEAYLSTSGPLTAVHGGPADGRPVA